MPPAGEQPSDPVEREAALSSQELGWPPARTQILLGCLQDASRRVSHCACMQPTGCPPCPAPPSPSSSLGEASWGPDGCGHPGVPLWVHMPPGHSCSCPLLPSRHPVLCGDRSPWKSNTTASAACLLEAMDQTVLRESRTTNISFLQRAPDGAQELVQERTAPQGRGASLAGRHVHEEAAGGGSHR